MTRWPVFRSGRSMAGTAHAGIQPISRHDEWCNTELRRRRNAQKREAQNEGTQA